MISVCVSVISTMGLWTLAAMGFFLFFLIPRSVSRKDSAWNFQFKCKWYRTSQRTWEKCEKMAGQP